MLLDNPLHGTQGFLLKDGFLFKGNRLCIPQTLLRDFLVWEMHAGGITGHLVAIKPLSSWRIDFIDNLSNEMLPKL